MKMSTLNTYLNALVSLPWGCFTTAFYAREVLKAVRNTIIIPCDVFNQHKDFLNKLLLDARTNCKGDGRSVMTAFKDLLKTVQISEGEHHIEIMFL
jgi:hypothetical protein